MKAITNFVQVLDFPIEVKLYGTLAEFQILVGHLSKQSSEPMAAFVKAIHDSIDTAEKQIEKKIDLPK